MPAPLRRDAERNRQRILEEARRLFTETGLGVSHDEIARAAQVGVGTVYRRFPAKEDLLAALFTEQVEQVVALAEAALERSDPADALRDFLAATLEMQARDRGLRQLLGGTSRPTALARGARERIAPVVQQLVERAQAAGTLRADVGVTDIALVPLAVGAVLDASRDVDPQVWRRTLALLLDGLRTAAPVDPLPGRAPSPATFERMMSSGSRTPSSSGVAGGGGRTDR
jgi:AcrR family transcriptional regulator